MRPLLLFHPPASYLQLRLRYPDHIPDLIRLRFPQASAEKRELLFERIEIYLLDESSEIDRITSMVVSSDLTSAVAYFRELNILILTGLGHLPLVTTPEVR